MTQPQEIGVAECMAPKHATVRVSIETWKGIFETPSVCLEMHYYTMPRRVVCHLTIEETDQLILALQRKRGEAVALCNGRPG